MIENPFFVFHPNYGLNWYASEDVAKYELNRILEIERDSANYHGEWDLEIGQLCWGTVCGSVKRELSSDGFDMKLKDFR